LHSFVVQLERETKPLFLLRTQRQPDEALERGLDLCQSSVGLLGCLLRTPLFVDTNRDNGAQQHQEYELGKDPDPFRSAVHHDDVGKGQQQAPQPG